eukprot:IDg21372t1
MWRRCLVRLATGGFVVVYGVDGTLRSAVGWEFASRKLATSRMWLRCIDECRMQRRKRRRTALGQQHDQFFANFKAHFNDFVSERKESVTPVTKTVCT